MICAGCRAAASLVTETQVIYQYLSSRPQEMLSGADAARAMHGGCRGESWCDCQHVIPVRSDSPAPTLVK